MNHLARTVTSFAGNLALTQFCTAIEGEATHSNGRHPKPRAQAAHAFKKFELCDG